MNIEPVQLRGANVALTPMTIEDIDGLATVGLDASIWEFMVERIRDREGMRQFVDGALRDRERGVALPFVTRIANSDKIVGTTRFGNIDTSNRRVEIGWTWIAPDWQRTIVNTEAKLLMLRHAFENWGCVRVEFKTDATNLRSRNAILRLGATEEGTLRRHMITDSGRFRDSVYFSILDTEWNHVKTRLNHLLEKHQLSEH